jgi:hypothetical protein
MSGIDKKINVKVKSLSSRKHNIMETLEDRGSAAFFLSWELI